MPQPFSSKGELVELISVNNAITSAQLVHEPVLGAVAVATIQSVLGRRDTLILASASFEKL